MCAHVMSPVCLHDNRHQAEHMGKMGQVEGCIFNGFDPYNVTLRNNKNISNNDRATRCSVDKDKDTHCLFDNQSIGQ